MVGVLAKEKVVINHQIYQFPIVYTSAFARFAIGWGVHTTVADECKTARIKNALIVTTGLRGTGIVDEIKQILTSNGVGASIFDKVTSNPKDFQVMEGYKAFQDAQCDGVVSVGGGSSHDCGKAIRVVATNEGKFIWDIAKPTGTAWMKEMSKYRTITIPQISVNTTAGTSAESSLGASLVNAKTHSEGGVDMPGQAPTIALVDPLLVRMMPATFAAWTGWDAFTHAFESYVSSIQVPSTLAMQLGAIRLIAQNLREFVYNRMNHKACENMCYAETMAGVGLKLGGGVGIVHGLANGIGKRIDSHHGRTMAVMTVPLERYNEPACPERFAEMAQAMGADTRGLTVMQAADRWFDEVERLLADLNIPTGRLNEQFKVPKSDLEAILTDAVNGYAKGRMREANPRDFDHDEGIKLLKGLI